MRLLLLQEKGIKNPDNKMVFKEVEISFGNSTSLNACKNFVSF